MKNHANIAIFIPHNGCMNQCSFCNQCHITGQCTQPSLIEVEKTISYAGQQLGEACSESEIAFFGGSFTAINREYMVSLLQVAADGIRKFGFKGIRLSTRPDAISPEILKILKNYGVTSIELGAQSMSDDVLLKNKRGHTAKDVRNAAKLIKLNGFTLGLQMMVGLPGDTPEGALKTAKEFVLLNAEEVRIYPTIVFPDTLLAKWLKDGSYVPMQLCEAIDLCSQLLNYFEQNKCTVLRVGLHASPELEQSRLAGPYHPAFRELCESQLLFNQIRKSLLEKQLPVGPICLRVHPRFVSVTVGQKHSNLQKLKTLGYSVKIEQSVKIPYGEFQILPDERTVCPCF